MEIQQHVLLAPYTTFHIGGLADYFIVAHTLSELKEAVMWAKTNQHSYFLLGKGANILVGDKGFRGVVIKNEATGYTFNGSTLTAQSGAVIEELIAASQKKGLSGFEHFAGIVSTVGGALWQNLHFLSPQRDSTVYIADMLESAAVMHENGREEIVDRAYFQFGYDKSILHNTKDIVLSATFALVEKNPDEIQKTIAANLLWRDEKHPNNARNCSAGSIFKKIEGYGSGRLIEKVGLKGKQIGGAKISDVHANFIVNTGNATAQDVRDLITLAQKTVKEDLRLDLEPEISFIGEF